MQPRSRLLLFDDNVRSMGGHFLELATLLIHGAEQLHFDCSLATHHSFDPSKEGPLTFPVYRTFQTRRMLDWSLGVDGKSVYQKDVTGRDIDATRLARLMTSVGSLLSRPSRRPSMMIEQWADGFIKACREQDLVHDDTIIVNTGDDFVMLALASALSRLGMRRSLNIHVIFHFAVFDLHDPNQQRSKHRASLFGRQVNAAIELCHPHRIHLHSTTESLSNQLSHVNVDAPAIPYPTRFRNPVGYTPHTEQKLKGPRKIVLAGMPRAEKGRRQIPAMLRSIHHPFLYSGEYQLSMQMPESRVREMIPDGMFDAYKRAVAENGQKPMGPLEIIHTSMPTETYHDWLDTADIGLFLYNPARYVARCSGVLLEMMIRGIPVIVPEGCWLSDQIRVAGGDGSIGLIYQTPEDIPRMIDRLHNDYDNIRHRAIAHSRTVANQHRPANTIMRMGVFPQQSSRTKIA